MKLDEALKKLYPGLYQSSFFLPDYSNAVYYVPYNGPRVNNRAGVEYLYQLYLKIKEKFPQTTFVNVRLADQLGIDSVEQAIPPCGISISATDIQQIIKAAKSLSFDHKLQSTLCLLQ